MLVVCCGLLAKWLRVRVRSGQGPGNALGLFFFSFSNAFVRSRRACNSIHHIHRKLILRIFINEAEVEGSVSVSWYSNRPGRVCRDRSPRSIQATKKSNI